MKVSGNDSRTQTPFNTNHKHRSFIRRVVEVSLHQRFLSTWLRLVLLLCLLAIHQVDQVVGIDMAAENGECLNGDPTNHGDTDDLQYLFIIRHGDRWDYSNEDVGLTFKSNCGTCLDSFNDYQKISLFASPFCNSLVENVEDVTDWRFPTQSIGSSSSGRSGCLSGFLVVRKGIHVRRHYLVVVSLFEMY